MPQVLLYGEILLGHVDSLSSDNPGKRNEEVIQSQGSGQDILYQQMHIIETLAARSDGGGTPCYARSGRWSG